MNRGRTSDNPSGPTSHGADPPMSKPTVIVTGAAGLIGSHVSEAMIARGYRVIGVDNFCDFYQRSWKEENVRAIGPGIDVEEMDIADGPGIKSLVARVKPEGVIHLAAM